MTTEMLTLKALSPLAIHARRSSEQFAPTLDYIPGSTIRGAFAELYLAGDSKRAREADFRQIFLADRVFFSDFFPATGEDNTLTRLLPATAAVCKRFDDHRAGSLSDSLLWRELLREWKMPQLDKFNQWKQCPECETEGLNGKLDRAEPGYYLSAERPTPIKVRTRMIASAAIERATGTSAHGMLFSHEVIEESGLFDDQGVFFRGTISLPDELRPVLHELVPLNSRLAVGYGRSRGLGQLQVRGWDSPRAERRSIRQRWKTLNEVIRQLWEHCEHTPDGQYFSLTLQSHLALLDRAGQPLLEDIQASDLGLPAEAERCYCVLNAVAVSGWNAALGLPKADTWALGRGSVLLFRLPPEIDPDPTLERLEELERDGAGERRMEGFGRMIACDPFHTYFTLRELKQGGF